MKAPWSKIPALPGAIGVVSGIILSAIGVNVWLTAGISLTLFILLYITKRHYAAFIILFVGIGAVMSHSRSPYNPPAALYDEKYAFTAEIDAHKETDRGIIYTLTVKSARSIGTKETMKIHPFKCRLTVIGVTEAIYCGSEVVFLGNLTPTKLPETYVSVPHQVNYDKYLEAEGITSKCTVMPSDIKVVKEPALIDRCINTIRDKLYNGIVDSPIEGNTASFLLATILGDDTFLTDETYNKYRATGTAHILALSGLHVGIIVSFLGILFLPMRLFRRGSPWRSAFTIILIWSYAVIVGLSPSIVRASVMVTVYICARHIQQGYSSYNSLLLSVIFILCINPWWLFTPGFQMSVAAVGTLLSLGIIIPKCLQRKRALYWVIMCVLVPIAAMIGTGIIGAYYFNTYPLLFLVANILVGILFPWLLGIGILLMALTMMGIECQMLGDIENFIFTVMDSSISDMAQYSWAQLGGLYFSAWAMLPYYLCIACVILAIAYRKRLYAITSLVALTAFFIVLRVTNENIPQAELYIPSNTGAPCIILRTGQSAWIYTDGPDISKYNERYSGFLDSRKVKSGFSPVNGMKENPFVVSLPYIIAGKTTIYIANDSLPIASNINKPDYVVIGRKYHRSITDIIEILKPDTLLLGANLYHSRRQKIIRLCSDSIPYKDLRKDGVKIVWIP